MSLKYGTNEVTESRRQPRALVLHILTVVAVLIVLRSANKLLPYVPHQVLDQQEVSAALTIKVENWYSQKHGAIGKVYPWLSDDAVIVDTRMPALVYVYNARHNVKLELVHYATGQTVRVEKPVEDDGVAKFEVLFDELGAYTLLGFELVESPEKSKPRAAKPKTVHSLRVRHEVRELNVHDREKLLDCLLTMYHVEGDAGRRRFGSDYVSAKEFQIWHHLNSAQRDADHFHQGFGFFVQHARITLQFEASLRAIDDRVVACPYWDFTIDETRTKLGKQRHVFDSELFGPQWWGGVTTADFSKRAQELFKTVAELDNFRIKNGRFTNITVVANMNIAEWRVRALHNAYSQVRAPWNNNPSPYVSRFVNENLLSPGASVFPTCSAHLNATTVPYPLAPWMWNIQNGPHANVHNVLGGSIITVPSTTRAAKLFSKLTNIRVSPENMATVIKSHTMFRLGIIDYPSTCLSDLNVDIQTYASTCIPLCNLELWPNYTSIGRQAILSRSTNDYVNEHTADSSLGSIFDLSFMFDYRTYQSIMNDALKRMRLQADAASIEDLEALGREYCAQVPTTIEGDQKDSSSALSPEFWSIHPTMERLYIRRLLTGVGFSDWDWPKHCACSASRADVCVQDTDGYIFGMEIMSNHSDDFEESIDLCRGHYADSRMFCNTGAQSSVHSDVSQFCIDKGHYKNLMRPDVRLGRSNIEILNLMDPRKPPAEIYYEYPVYHHFKMDHCDEEFPSLD